MNANRFAEWSHDNGHYGPLHSATFRREMLRLKFGYRRTETVRRFTVLTLAPR